MLRVGVRDIIKLLWRLESLSVVWVVRGQLVCVLGSGVTLHGLGHLLWVRGRHLMEGGGGRHLMRGRCLPGHLLQVRVRIGVQRSTSECLRSRNPTLVTSLVISLVISLILVTSLIRSLALITKSRECPTRSVEYCFQRSRSSAIVTCTPTLPLPHRTT